MMSEPVPRPAEGESAPRTAGELGREFFAALDARDPRRLRATLADHASFRAMPHQQPVRLADEILAYFGSVVSSYPTARWEVSDVISDGDRAAIQILIREPSERWGREVISEQMAVVRTSNGRIVSITGYYDSAEFRRVFWDE
ncbi:MAG TPA: nuclear transport factor 2 family protein [Thermomicrobiales bacterium]|nr:nuclear transport factor 2 family protein [Thermomicrobiales bacterium]